MRNQDQIWTGKQKEWQMAHVPVTVATVKPDSPRAAGSLTGKKPAALRNVKDKQSGKTGAFTDALKKAGGDKLSTGRMGKTNKRIIVKDLSLKKLSIESGITLSRMYESADSAGKSDNDNIQESVAGNTELSAENSELSNLLNQSGQTIRLVKNTSVSSTRKHSGNRRINTEKKMKPNSSGNLTSSSRRIDVLDNRRKVMEIDTKLNNPGKIENKSHRPDTAAFSKNTSEPVRLEHNPLIAETEIEISPRGEGKTSQRSAAAELAQKLDAQAGNDIVRQVKVVLNRADSGEVQINLRPDNLGKVKISIRMENNRLTGRIFVETAAAREAFRSALDGLQTKLVESGFGSADLELAWDETPRGFNQNENQTGKQRSRRKEAIQEFENITPTAASDEAAYARVNMVV